MDPTPAFIEVGDDDLPAPKKLSAEAQHRQRESNKRVMRRLRGDETPVPRPQDAPDIVPDDEVTTSDDLAAVVVRQTLRRIASGHLKPTLRDGIQAQSLLDKRAEKAADRSFMLNLASALAGGGHQVPQKLLPPPDDAIEGDFTEVNLAPEHLRAE